MTTLTGRIMSAETLIDMAEVEGFSSTYDEERRDANGVAWLLSQMDSIEDPESSQYTWGHALRMRGQSGHVTIYGIGGGNRWYVDLATGEVAFSRHHTSRTATVELAEKLGFEIR